MKIPIYSITMMANNTADNNMIGTAGASASNPGTMAANSKMIGGIMNCAAEDLMVNLQA